MSNGINITSKMHSVNQILIDQCEGMNHCISTLGRNLLVEVPREDCAKVVAVLKREYEDVVDIREAYQMIEDLHDFILVKPLISEAPLFSADGIPVPSAEKQLVDLFSDKEYIGVNSAQKVFLAQRLFELSDINLSKVMRYAGRKGKKEEMTDIITGLSKYRKNIIASLRSVLSKSPVSKAWMFGSFARMEERPDSDLDILIELSSTIGMFAYSAIVNELETVTGRKVDLVANGSLKPYARESVERDKVLIYERSASGPRKVI